MPAGSRNVRVADEHAKSSLPVAPSKWQNTGFPAPRTRPIASRRRRGETDPAVPKPHQDRFDPRIVCQTLELDEPRE